MSAMEKASPQRKGRSGQPALQLGVEPSHVTSRDVVHGGMRLASAELNERDGVEGGVELGVRQVLDEPARGSALRVLRVERRVGKAVLDVLADDTTPFTSHSPPFTTQLPRSRACGASR